ncbi:MAG TPA: alpha/beta hydrolase-fold protein [Acidimicrobiia bacterium]
MKATDTWFSERLGQDLTVVRWGMGGAPVLIFPTAGGDCEEIERFHVISVLEELIEAGRIRVYSVDSINGRAWLTGAGDEPSSRLMTTFDAAIRFEVVPAIWADNGQEKEVIVAGSSIGAFNALEVLCRHPDVFSAALCLSGTYDLSRWLDGPMPPDFYFSSPIHYLPGLDGPHLDALRQRFVLLAHGLGMAEDPAQSWQTAAVLGGQGVPNRVDEWGPEWPHDWVTWRAMFPRYLEELIS